jgi:cytochrome c biogenesis protein CcdA
MKQLLEWSGMGIVVAGIVIAIVGLVVLVITQSSWLTYVIGYAVGLLGIAILFWGALRDRLRARKTDDLDDVGFH